MRAWRTTTITATYTSTETRRVIGERALAAGGEVAAGAVAAAAAVVAAVTAVVIADARRGGRARSAASAGS